MKEKRLSLGQIQAEVWSK